MGLSSPTNFYSGRLTSSSAIVNIGLFKKFDIGLSSPFKLAWGGEMRIENFSIKHGDEASYIDGQAKILDGPNKGKKAPSGAQGFPGFRPEDEKNKSRTNKSLYLDLEQTFMKKLLVGLAGRYETYSDFGSTINGKASFRYEPIQNLFLRASAGTGFRAPSLAQSYYSYSQSSFISGTPYSLGIFPVDHPVSRALGAENLKPESSININIGIAGQIKKKIFISLDYFKIDIKNRITLTPNLTPDLLPNFKYVFDTLNIEGSRYFFNGMNTSTQGVDFNLNSNFDFRKRGILSFLVSATFSETKIIGDVKLPGVLSDYSDAVFDRDYINRITKVQPGSNLMAQVNYKIRRFDFLVRANKYGKITFIHKSSDPQYDQTYASKVMLDAEFSYKLTSKINLSIGGHNILNTYPDKSYELPGDYLSGKIRTYNWYSPFGFQGASYYGKIVLLL